MSAELSLAPPSFEQLDRRRLEIWPRRVEDSIALRMRRATSWLQRAELAMDAMEVEDYDAACIFYWIALNAAYAQDIPLGLARGRTWTETDEFKAFADKVFARDTGNSLAKLVFDVSRKAILRLTEDVYLYKGYWLSRNGVYSGQGWRSRFEKECISARQHLMRGDYRLVREILPVIFDRLYVLRNQLVHGGATWRSSVNRTQIETGATVLATIVPSIISIMLENSSEDWGPCFYAPTLSEQSAAVQRAMDLPDAPGR